MRRTEQEFKAEVLRRSQAYKARRRKRIKIALSAAACFAFGVMISAFWPVLFSASNDTASANMAAPEAVMDMNSNGGMPDGFDDFMQRNDSAENQKEESGTAEAADAIYVLAGEEKIPLTPEETAVITEYVQLGQGEWVDSLADCAADCTLIIDGVRIRYHSSCGTFQDYSKDQSRRVSEEARLAINEILKRYTNLESA